MTPAQAAVRFGWGLVLGGGLGLLYGFLRPLRRRHQLLPDTLFIAAAFYAWLILSFPICQGDIRLGITAALPIGGILWEMTAGRVLRPVFCLFWKVVFRIFSILSLPFKKIIGFFLNFLKKVFAYIKKWVTIGWNIRRHRRESGGDKHDHRQQEV